MHDDALATRKRLERHMPVPQEGHDGAQEAFSRVVEGHGLHVMIRVPGPRLEGDGHLSERLGDKLYHTHAPQLVRLAKARA